MGQFILILKLFLFTIFYSSVIGSDYKIHCDLQECSCFKNEIKCDLNRTVKSVVYAEKKKQIDLINLSYNNIERIDYIQNVNSIKKLNLQCNNLIEFPEHLIINMPYMDTLDVSSNKINDLKESAFLGANYLQKLNMSNSFRSGFLLSRELCELVNLKVLDLSYLDLKYFNLECWKKENINLTEIYFKHTNNIESSWSNWFPYIGDNLKVLDLTNSNLHTIDSSIARKMINLDYISLSHNPSIKTNTIVELLKTENFIDRLKYLFLSNITANFKNLPLDQIISHANNISLIELDISNNNYSDMDLNTFLFNQVKFKSLKSFSAANNQFNDCAELLISNDTTLLPNLEIINFSFNNITGANCFFSIRLCDKLEVIDFSHNKISFMHSDLVSKGLVNVFEDMKSLRYIDLSHNRINELVLNFKPNHTKLEKINLSHNNLNNFRFLSDNFVKSPKYPFNIEEETHNFDDYDYLESELSNASTNEKQNKSNQYLDDDDERYLIIELLDLSHNHFKHINLQHMMQSVRNVQTLNLSQNPIEKVVRLSDERLSVDTKRTEDIYTEILCIDEVDLSHCKIHHLPNFEHTCINKANFRHNSFSNKQFLVISKLSTFFLDYLDLQWNNITQLIPITSTRVFKQDSYKNKNSPVDYALGSKYARPGTKIHTYVDLKQNKFYQCDCDVMKKFRRQMAILVLNECLDDEKFNQNCFNNYEDLIKYGNRIRLTIGYSLLCVCILIALFLCFKCLDLNRCSNSIEKLRSFVRQLVLRLSGNKLDTENSLRIPKQNKDSKVIYSKLENEMNSSNIDLNVT